MVRAVQGFGINLKTGGKALDLYLVHALVRLL